MNPEAILPLLDTGKTFAELLANVDDDIREAVAEVDRTLIQESLKKSPFERLEACTRTARALAKFRRVPS